MEDGVNRWMILEYTGGIFPTAQFIADTVDLMEKDKSLVFGDLPDAFGYLTDYLIHAVWVYRWEAEA